MPESLVYNIYLPCHVIAFKPPYPYLPDIPYPGTGGIGNILQTLAFLEAQLWMLLRPHRNGNSCNAGSLGRRLRIHSSLLTIGCVGLFDQDTLGGDTPDVYVKGGLFVDPRPTSRTNGRLASSLPDHHRKWSPCASLGWSFDSLMEWSLATLRQYSISSLLDVHHLL
jgi:hypothetical protein